MTDPAPCRRGLDWLLALHPGLTVLRVDYGRARLEAPVMPSSSWCEVDLGQASEGGIEAFAVHRYAIWKNTGAVHPIGHDGAVTDDPMYRP